MHWRRLGAEFGVDGKKLFADQIFQ